VGFGQTLPAYRPHRREVKSDVHTPAPPASRRTPGRGRFVRRFPAVSPASATPTLSIPTYLVSALQIDEAHNTVTLPLFQGSAPGRGKTWFVVTESSDLREAVRLGVN